MKKFILVTVLFSIYSCQNEIDTFNDSPNSPTSVTPSLLLTQAEVATFNIHSSDMSRIPAILTQQIAGNDFQYATYGQYSFLETDMDNSWNTVYQNFGEVAYDNIKKFGADNPYYRGMSKVLLALNIVKASDFWNDVPLSNAFKGNEGIIQPTYDTQQSIYVQAQQLLTDAISDFALPVSSNTKLPASDDLIYNGDVTKWTKAAYTLKARYALRLTKRDGDVVAANKALSYLAAGAISSNSEDMNAIFSATSSASWNQWYAFEQSRPNYLKMGKYFVDYLVSTSDPRLPFYASQDASSSYSGVASNGSDNDASDIGPAFNGPDKPLGLITFAEAKFIEAEAKFLISDGTAQQTFKDAVSASLQNYVGSVDVNFVNAVTTNLTLENIIQQKYIALFTNPEVYNDWRRTGFPVLTPNPDAAVGIPNRMPTPSYERLYNPNATVVSNTTAKVWWAN